MISHELRTPLQAISGYCDLLMHEASAPLNAEQESDLRAIRVASEELVRLLNDILDFARLESRTTSLLLEPVPLPPALARAEALINPKLAEAQLQYARLGCEGGAVRANADRLQQILLNLLTNAIKFTPRGGRITIESSRDDRLTRVAVRDTGCGIPRESLGHIFEPFVQIDRQRIEARQRGVGLGLSICRELAHAMSGELSAESEVGVGSVFTLSLPTAEAEEEKIPSEI